MMKRTTLMLLLLAGGMLSAVAQPQEISLCGEWLFVADSADYSAGLPAEAMIVNVPHTYNTMEGLEDYAGRAWYERRLHVPMEMKGRQLRLQFEADNSSR